MISVVIYAVFLCRAHDLKPRSQVRRTSSRKRKYASVVLSAKKYRTAVDIQSLFVAGKYPKAEIDIPVYIFIKSRDIKMVKYRAVFIPINRFFSKRKRKGYPLVVSANYHRFL